MTSRVIRRVFVEEELESAGWDLFVRYDDQEFSFTDCTSFALMPRSGVEDALTFDDGFRRAGFRPRPGHR